MTSNGAEEWADHVIAADRANRPVWERVLLRLRRRQIRKLIIRGYIVGHMEGVADAAGLGARCPHHPAADIVRLRTGKRYCGECGTDLAPSHDASASA